MTYYGTKHADKINEPGVYLLGFGFDGTACFRKGAKKGPHAIREVSDGIESYSPYLKKDVSSYDCFYDLGDLKLEVHVDHEEIWNNGNKEFEKLTKDIDLSKIKLLTLGGEHSISYAPIKKYLENFKDLVLVHLDAHADLRDGYEGYHYSHASIIRRSLDHFGPEHELIQYGIRSGTKIEFDEMNKRKSQCHSLNELTERLLGVEKSRPVYLTFDLDYFDPSVFPGTGTPEPGGEDFHSFIKIIKILNNKNLVGADIVELAPELDSSGCSSVVATKVVREVLLAMV